MNELKEYLKRELGISDEEYLRLVEEKKQESPITTLAENDDVLMLGLADSYETQLTKDMIREEETTAFLLALSEAYELILQLQARIEALEGGNN